MLIYNAKKKEVMVKREKGGVTSSVISLGAAAHMLFFDLWFLQLSLLICSKYVGIFRWLGRLSSPDLRKMGNLDVAWSTAKRSYIHRV